MYGACSSGLWALTGIYRVLRGSEQLEEGLGYLENVVNTTQGLEVLAIRGLKKMMRFPIQYQNSTAPFRKR